MLYGSKCISHFIGFVKNVHKRSQGKHMCISSVGLCVLNGTTTMALTCEIQFVTYMYLLPYMDYTTYVGTGDTYHYTIEELFRSGISTTCSLHKVISQGVES